MGGVCVQQLQLQFIFICDSIIFLVACHYFGVVIHCIGLCCVATTLVCTASGCSSYVRDCHSFFDVFWSIFVVVQHPDVIVSAVLVSRSDQARRGVICQNVVYIRLGVAAQQLGVACNHLVV